MEKGKCGLISQDDLHRWLNYNPDTGDFTWKEKPPKSNRPIGSIAGSVLRMRDGRFRRMLWVNGIRIYANRAAFIYVHGDIPKNALIDHIDGDTCNDRISNLRFASTAQNVWNRLSAGARAQGVSKDARGRFKARIQAPSGIKINLGTWETEAEAHAAYMGASAVLHGDFTPRDRASKSNELSDTSQKRKSAGKPTPFQVDNGGR